MASFLEAPIPGQSLTDQPKNWPWENPPEMSDTEDATRFYINKLADDDVMDDLSVLFGGGMPVAAFGGRSEIMHSLAPLGPVYQAGTLSGNPVAMSAGLVMLDEVSQPGFYEQLTDFTSKLLAGLKERAIAANVPFLTNQAGGMFGIFFTDQLQVTCFAETMACDAEKFSRFFHLMLAEGVYLAPSAFEAGFVSSAHGDKELAHTLNAAERAFAKL